MLKRIAISLLIIGSNLFLNAQEKVKEKLELIMDEQEAAWNRGDIEGFMAAYWKSDSLVFKGGNGTQYGWQRTLDNYKRSYPNKAAMGILTFQNTGFDLKEDKLDPRAFIDGKWKLERENDTLEGDYKLQWRIIEGEWKIIYDHSTSIE